MKKKQFYVGGQAIIEGVMMKTPNWVSAAVRKQSGKIVTVRKRYGSLTQKSWFLRMPFVRGVIFLGEMMVLGIKMLNWSANQQAKSQEEKLSGWETGITLISSLALAVVLFIVAPYYLARILTKTSGIMFNLIDGIFRILIFIGYIWAIGLFKDVKRLYQYHGAEHMTVHCKEHNLTLTPDNVRKFSPVHSRCGTSLLMFVIIVSILLFSLIHDQRWYVNVPVRILLIPVIAGISYELLKLSARFPKNLILQIMMIPGLWAQKITTKKPDKKQIEVAIAALKKVA
ncbi:MAG: DUF1385 domain-containing protein [Candidatus Woesearchaeota archaeon]